MQIRTILYQYIKTLIKHVFLLNFTYELLMSFRNMIKGVATWDDNAIQGCRSQGAASFIVQKVRRQHGGTKLPILTTTCVFLYAFKSF